MGWVGVGVDGCGVGWFTNFKSSNRIEISWFIQVLSCFNRFGPSPWGGSGGWVWFGGGVSIELKSSNIIEISWFVKFLIFDWFQGSPLERWAWVDGGGSMSEYVGCPMHMCMHTHACVYTCEQWCHNGIPIYDPFKSQLKWRLKCKIWIWCYFYHRTVNHRKICNAPLDASMCSLQIINWHWTSIINPSWSQCMLYPPIPLKKGQFWLRHQFFQRAVKSKKIWNVLLDLVECVPYKSSMTLNP